MCTVQPAPVVRGVGTVSVSVVQHAGRRSMSCSSRSRNRSACRSLFGAVDHEELNRDMEAKLREISERDKKRWNFNFTADTPLLGEYEWEGSAEEATPLFYQEAVQVGKKRAVSLRLLHPHTDAPNVENCARDTATVPPGVGGGGGVSAESCNKRRKGTGHHRRVTDFYVKRRKHGDLKSQKSFSSVYSEQTPRKRLR